jgi:hypothetical protein
MCIIVLIGPMLQVPGNTGVKDHGKRNQQFNWKATEDNFKFVDI